MASRQASSIQFRMAIKLREQQRPALLVTVFARVSGSLEVELALREKKEEERRKKRTLSW
jgi:hypothetical protein